MSLASGEGQGGTLVSSWNLPSIGTRVVVEAGTSETENETWVAETKTEAI